MNIQFSINSEWQTIAKAYITFARDNFDGIPLSEIETTYILKQLTENNFSNVNRYNELLFVVYADQLKDHGVFREQCRRAGNEIAGVLKREKIVGIDLMIGASDTEAAIAIAEGIALGSYQFMKYKTSLEKISWHLEKINFAGNGVSKITIDQLSAIVEAVCIARDLVNEPEIGRAHV